MKKYFILIAIFFLLVSCAHRKFDAAITHFTDPGAPNFYHSVGRTNTGEACVTNILGIYKFGDGSVDKAMLNGSIGSVRSVDKSTFNFFGIWDYTCTQVTGSGGATMGASYSPYLTGIKEIQKTDYQKARRPYSIVPASHDNSNVITNNNMTFRVSDSYSIVVSNPHNVRLTENELKEIMHDVLENRDMK